MALVPTDGSKDTLKRYGDLWNKGRDLIRSTTNNSGNNDEKCMKVKLNSSHNLTLKKMLELYNMVRVVRSDFHEGNK